MGAPMAGHLAKAGHDVCVYNRTQQKAHDWALIYGGRVASTPAEAADKVLNLCLLVLAMMMISKR